MKFLYGHFDQNTGESIVVLADKYGRYVGKTNIAKQDIKYKSKYFGCFIAQKKAYLKYLSAKIYRNKIMLKAVKNLNKDIQYNCQSIDSKIQHRINLKIRDYNNEILQLQNDISQLKKSIEENIRTRDKIVARSKLNKK